MRLRKVGGYFFDMFYISIKAEEKIAVMYNAVRMALVTCPNSTPNPS